MNLVLVTLFVLLQTSPLTTELRDKNYTKTTDERIRISRLALKFVWFTTLIPMALLR